MAGSDDGRFTVGFQIGMYPEAGLAGFQCAVLTAGEPPLVISENEIPFPPTLWEIRASGLWADHVCEREFEHWSYGLEAFAIAIDDGQELLGRGYGERAALGWELEFEGVADEVDVTSDHGYCQHGRLHGILLFASGQVPFEGPARRHHWWGGPHAGPEDDQVSDRPVVEVALPTPVDIWWLSRSNGGRPASRSEVNRR